MSIGCPLCGAPIVDDGCVLVDLESGLVVGGGRVAQLTGQEAVLFEALWVVRPRMLGREQLLAALYSLLSSGDEAEIKIIDIYVCKLRRKLAGMDITIETVWARGYRLVVGREAQRSRAGDASADRANLGELLS